MTENIYARRNYPSYLLPAFVHAKNESDGYDDGENGGDDDQGVLPVVGSGDSYIHMLLVVLFSF